MHPMVRLTKEPKRLPRAYAPLLTDLGLGERVKNDHTVRNVFFFFSKCAEYSTVWAAL